MKQQSGQAALEWLMVSMALLSIVWFAAEQWDLVTQMRQWGKAVIAHYHFIFSYLALAPGSGL